MKYSSLALSLTILGISSSLAVGCSSSGGSPGTGGTTGAGGSTGTGGSTSSGGTPGSGGVKASGGTTGSGGSTGATGSGGAAGSSGTGGEAGAGGAAGSTGTGGAAGTTGAAGSGATDAGAADGPVTYTLTVKNYFGWCDVTENGTTYAAGVPPATSFPKDAVVNLKAVPNAIFVWGYWIGTDGDTTAAHDTNMVTTAKMDSSKTVYACCPDPGTSCPDPSTWL
jgi:hypothetical protein